MLDRFMRPVIDPPLRAVAGLCVRLGLSANAVTMIGLGLGVASAIAIALGQMWWALGLLLVSRAADGLDGAVARQTGPTDFGGYLDIVADFVFYAAVPLGFIVLNPAQNALAGAVLIATFYINAATFLGFAILAAKRGLSTDARGKKAWYHAGGLMEGTETIAFFVAFCLWPGLFTPIALVFAVLCLVTAVARTFEARALF